MINKICSVEGCGRKKEYELFCKKHYNRFRMFGFNSLSKYDRNKIILKEDCAEIVILNIKHIEIARATIDLDDVKRVKKYKIHLGLNYAIMKIKNKNIPLHRFIIRAKKGEIVDHINRNIMDDRKCNLRIVSKSLNCFNSKIRINNTTGKPGVLYNKRRNTFTVRLTKDYKNIYGGDFKNFDDAVKVRDELEIKYFGEVIER